MADKKKKIFTSKESTTPRRPVILKSDRGESAKDQAKEKQEKEKQPTIILKTREHSAPKEERPQSPKKTSTSESDGHPSIHKIAQNENKEKKNTEQKQSPPLKFMTEPLKLLDENLELNSAALEFLHDSSTNYLVVGIIGTQGVGKSMILNLIANNVHDQNLCMQILNSHEMPADNTFDSNEVGLENQLESLDYAGVPEPKVQDKPDSTFKFKMQDIEQIERGVHCTKGIDMYITNDRVILLDCQALWSPSLIEESNTAVTARSANVLTVDCLQIASYLMATCHVLIAVQDWFTDYNFLRYIQAAEMLKPSLSASNTVPTNQEGSESTGGGESHPHLLLLHNRCQLEDFTPESLSIMQDLYRKAFQKSNLQLNSGMYMYSDTNKNSLNVDSVCKGYSIDKCGTPINLFLLPEIYSDFDNRDIYRGHPAFEHLAKRLRWMILGVNRHQITNVPNLSEKGWFHYCSKAWETIRKCTFFMEYERVTMKSWLEASGMDDGSLSCMLAEPREALLPITGRENLAPRKRDRTLEPCAMSEEAYLSSGAGSPCAGLSREERRRRRRATLKYRTAHATRERIRVEAFNAAFGSLRRLLPTLPPDKKLSKIEILRLAICYIAYLNHVLDA